MRLSNLQTYILKKCHEQRGQIPKKVLFSFYSDKKSKPSAEDMQNIITKSVDRLIKKELLVGFGKKTAQKWFVEKVKITAAGKKYIKEALKKRQQKLPIK